MSDVIKQGQALPEGMAQALGVQPYQPTIQPNAGWMQPGGQPTGAVFASASAPIGAQYHQPQPAVQPQANGLAAMGALASGQSIPRRGRSFEFPPEVWGAMPDVKPEHRKFFVKRLSVPEEQRAQANAQGTNFMAALSEMALESVKRIGEIEATYDVKQGMAVYGPGGWWEAISSVGRRLVEQAYHNVNQPDSAVGEFMVANAQDGWA